MSAPEGFHAVGGDASERVRSWMQLSEPQTPPEALARIAMQYPEFAAAIAAHPRAYPELVEWAHAQLAAAGAQSGQVVATSDAAVSTLERSVNRAKWIIVGVIVVTARAAQVLLPAGILVSGGAPSPLSYLLIVTPVLAVAVGALILNRSAAQRTGAILFALLALAYSLALVIPDSASVVYSALWNLAPDGNLTSLIIVVTLIPDILLWASWAVAYPIRAGGTVGLLVLVACGAAMYWYLYGGPLAQVLDERGASWSSVAPLEVVLYVLQVVIVVTITALLSRRPRPIA